MFSFRLYKEALRRSLASGIIYSAIMLLGAVVNPVMEIREQSRMLAAGAATSRLIIRDINNNFIFGIGVFVFSVVIVMQLFSFLRHRNGSDFYHSIPHKRESIFLTNLAVTVTWLISLIFIGGAISGIIYATAGSYVSLNVTAFVISVLNSAVISLMIVGVLLVAMGITGTTFSTFVAALLIVFLPQAATSAFVSTVVRAAGVITADSFGIFSGAIFGEQLFGTIYSTGNFEMVARFYFSGLLFALICFVVAFFLFKRRKSEAAGFSATSPLAQTVIAAALTFAICLIALSQVFDGWSPEWFIIVYFLAVLAYVIYELVSYKRINWAKRFFVGLLVVAVLNGAFIGGTAAVREIALSRRIDTGNVTSVRLVDFNAWSQDWGSNPTGFGGSVEIADSEVIALLAEGLERDVARVRAGRHRGDSAVLDSGPPPAHLIFSTVGVAFNTDTGRIRRQIVFNSGEMAELLGLLALNETFAAEQMYLPESPADIRTWHSERERPSEEVLREIYAVFREEVSQVDFAVWFAMSHNMWHLVEDGGDDISFSESIVVSVFDGARSYRRELPVTNLTPRSYEMMKEHFSLPDMPEIDVESE